MTTEHAATAEPPGRGTWRWVLLAVALVVAVTGVFGWWQASHDADRDRAESRDAVLIQARQAIATMNTLDYRSVDQGVKAWTAVTTGTLRDQLASVSAEDRTLLGEQGKVSSGRVVDASIVDLDGRTATVIAAVEVTVKDGAEANAKSTVKRNRFTADDLLAGKARQEYDTLFASLKSRAPKQKLTLTAQVQAIGVKDLTDDTAQLLVFLDQSSQRAGDDESSVSAAQLAVTAKLQSGVWKVTGLKPL